jgi:hypothetical protein
MISSPSDLQGKVELLRSMERAMRGPDKRKTPRTPIRLAVHVRFAGKSQPGPWTDAQLWDISQRGIRLSTRLELKVGDSLAIRFPSKLGTAAPAPLLCRVAHCESQKDDLTIAGAQFIAKLTEP